MKGSSVCALAVKPRALGAPRCGFGSLTARRDRADILGSIEGQPRCSSATVRNWRRAVVNQIDGTGNQLHAKDQTVALRHSFYFESNGASSDLTDVQLSSRL